ncbi:MAG TPA: DMT family transporter [Thiothrix sp.]|nr:DMT family transporter [Thiothrix sp.]
MAAPTTGTIILAFITVVVIWSTTPLTIAWSGEGVGFLFGITSRMVISTVLASGLMWVLHRPMNWHRQALWAYFASGIGIYIALMGAYWSATLIPSGWISVIFGTSAVFTGIMAHYLLQEHLSWYRVLGLLLAISGLLLIFYEGQQVDSSALWGVGICLVAVIGQSSTAVWIKKIDAKQTGLTMTTGGLWVATPLCLITWLMFDGTWPEDWSNRALASIVYLSIFGSLLGFSLYYFLIHHIQASRLALITLITPVTALLLGHLLNQEVISVTVILGTLFILLGLTVFQWGNRLHRKKYQPSKDACEKPSASSESTG